MYTTKGRGWGFHLEQLHQLIESIVIHFVLDLQLQLYCLCAS